MGPMSDGNEKLFWDICGVLQGHFEIVMVRFGPHLT